MADVFSSISDTAGVLLAVAVLWLSGFLMSRVTKMLRLPNVTGYIFAGIVIGPYALNLIPSNIIGGMDFITDVALSFIAFGVGRYLRLDRLRQQGAKVIVLTLMEALVTAAVVTLCMLFVFRLPLAFSLLLGAIGSATAPASSLMTIRQYRAKGNFVNTLVQVVAMDDAVALLAFSACSAVAAATEQAAQVNWQAMLTPLWVNMAVVFVSFLLGRTLCVLLNGRSSDHRLVLTCAFVFVIAAGCAALDVSPLLGCMVLGATFANVSGDKELFKQMNRVTPPINVMFFVLSGMRLNLPALQTAGIIGVTYFGVRIIGKFLGSYLGARVTGASAEVRRYLGLALIPQAGVSIGLAVLAQRLLPEESGALLSTIILSSSVLYEMIGPVCARRALFLSGAIKAGTKPILSGSATAAVKPDSRKKPEAKELEPKKKVEAKEPEPKKKPDAKEAEGKASEKKGGKKGAEVKKRPEAKKAAPQKDDMPAEAAPGPKPRWSGASERLWTSRREKGPFGRSLD